MWVYLAPATITVGYFYFFKCFLIFLCCRAALLPFSPRQEWHCACLHRCAEVLCLALGPSTETFSTSMHMQVSMRKCARMAQWKGAETAFPGHAWAQLGVSADVLQSSARSWRSHRALWHIYACASQSKSGGGRRRGVESLSRGLKFL